jgi:hypothetical protein
VFEMLVRIKVCVNLSHVVLPLKAVSKGRAGSRKLASAQEGKRFGYQQAREGLLKVNTRRSRRSRHVSYRVGVHVAVNGQRGRKRVKASLPMSKSRTPRTVDCAGARRLWRISGAPVSSGWRSGELTCRRGMDGD